MRALETTLPEPTGRPESWDDLDDDTKYPERVITINLATLNDVEFELATEIYRVAAQAKRDRAVVVDRNCGEVIVYLILYLDGQKQILKNAQRRWDQMREHWEAVMLCRPKHGIFSGDVTYWAKRSGVPIPTSEQYDAQRLVTNMPEATD